MTVTELCRYWLARFMKFATEFELAIAEATGRNPEQVRQLKRDYSDWLHQVQRMEWERAFYR